MTFIVWLFLLYGIFAALSLVAFVTGIRRAPLMYEDDRPLASLPEVRALPVTESCEWLQTAREIEAARDASAFERRRA